MVGESEGYHVTRQVREERETEAQRQREREREFGMVRQGKAKARPGKAQMFSLASAIIRGGADAVSNIKEQRSRRPAGETGDGLAIE